MPKSSLSSRLSGRAAQLMAIKGLSNRELFMWIVRAASSFPVPLSPVIRTFRELSLTFSINFIISRILGLVPIMLLTKDLLLGFSFEVVFSLFKRAFDSWSFYLHP